MTRTPLIFCQISRAFGLSQRATCSMRRRSGVWGPSNLTINLTAHAISRRGCSHGRRGTSLKFMMLPTTLGEAAHHPRNPAPCVFATARLQGIGITHVLSSRDGGVTTPHPQGAPCAIHAWRLSFYVSDTLPLLFLIRLRDRGPPRRCGRPR